MSLSENTAFTSVNNNSVKGVLVTFCFVLLFKSSMYFTKGHLDLPGEAIELVPEFLRNPIATCDYPGVSPDPLSPLWIRPCHLKMTCLCDSSQSHVPIFIY